MKKILLLAAIPALCLWLPSCRRDDNEPSTTGPFTINASLPEDTGDDDAVYIIGDFNGGEEFALGNPAWKLQKGSTKWTVGLDPEKFIGGKTLADGYFLMHLTRGVEVDASGAPVVRTLDAVAGKTYEIEVVAWEKEAGKHFDPSGTWTVVGTVNSWNQAAGLAMEVSGDVRIAKGVKLTASDEFKFVMDASWDTNFGAGEPNTKFAAKVDEEFELQADGGNITAPAGTYDIYLYPFEAKAKLVKAGEEPPQPQEKPVTGVSVAPASLSLKVGETGTLTATVTPADADVKSSVWSSNATSVATVSQSGVVTAVAEGEATITITVDGFTATCAVTVEADDPGPGPDPQGDAKLLVYDGNAWGTMRLWVWNDGGNLYPAWPGGESEGTEEVSGHSFYKFTLPEAWCGDGVNVIFTDGNGNQTSDLSFDIAAGKTYYFNVSGVTATIIDDPASFNPQPPVQDDAWGIAGNMNGWSAVNPIPMELSGDAYVAKGVSLTADSAFKFVQNKSWTVNRGGTFVTLGEAFDVYQDGADIKPGLTGTYDIYIKVDGTIARIENH